MDVGQMNCRRMQLQVQYPPSLNQKIASHEEGEMGISFYPQETICN